VTTVTSTGSRKKPYSSFLHAWGQVLPSHLAASGSVVGPARPGGLRRAADVRLELLEDGLEVGREAVRGSRRHGRRLLSPARHDPARAHLSAVRPASALSSWRLRPGAAAPPWAAPSASSLGSPPCLLRPAAASSVHGWLPGVLRSRLAASPASSSCGRRRRREPFFFFGAKTFLNCRGAFRAPQTKGEQKGHRKKWRGS